MEDKKVIGYKDKVLVWKLLDLNLSMDSDLLDI